VRTEDGDAVFSRRAPALRRRLGYASHAQCRPAKMRVRTASVNIHAIHAVRGV